jgi:hypothetical protein
VYVATAVAVLATAVPALAAEAPPIKEPQDAVAIVKRILTRHMKACKLDWARIGATGFEGDWTINVKVRSSRAGKGTARWHIGDSWPIARGPLAKAIVHDCPADQGS